MTENILHALVYYVAGLIVFLFALALIGLLIMSFVNFEKTQNFLRLFASSAKAHYIEQLSRLIVGVGLIMYSPHMWQSILFKWAGWLITITAIVLLLIPWRWHHRFGELVIPMVNKHLLFYASASCLLGLTILYGMIQPIMN